MTSKKRKGIMLSSGLECGLWLTYKMWEEKDGDDRHICTVYSLQRRAGTPDDDEMQHQRKERASHRHLD
jgi:hypothetical protein